MENGNRAEAGHILHTLKGVSGNLSITDVHAISELLDTSVKQNRDEGMESLIESLSNSLEIAIASIRRLETEPESETDASEYVKETMDLSGIKELFMEMPASFEEYNPKAVEPFMEKLGRFLSPRQLEPIKKRVDGFDFDGARDETLKLAESLDVEMETR